MTDEYPVEVERSRVEVEDDDMLRVDETAKFTEEKAALIINGLVSHGGGKSPAIRWESVKEYASEVESTRETMESDYSP